MEDDPLDSIASLLQDDPLADLLLGGEEIEEKEEIDDDDVEERTIEEDVDGYVMFYNSQLHTHIYTRHIMIPPKYSTQTVTTLSG